MQLTLFGGNTKKKEKRKRIRGKYERKNKPWKLWPWRYGSPLSCIYRYCTVNNTGTLHTYCTYITVFLLFHRLNSFYT
jgi:hypothetical protein